MKTTKKKGFRKSTGAAEVLAGLLEKRSAGVVRRWQKRHFAVGVFWCASVWRLVMPLLNGDAIRSSAGTTSTTLRTRTLRS